MDYYKQSPIQTREIICPRRLSEFSPIPVNLKQRPIVIAIPLHNQAKSLGNALQSAIAQTSVQGEQATILILDDCSSDNWRETNAHLLSHPSIAIIQGHCGSPARARNALLDYVDANFQSRWVCRLDADDQLATPNSVEALCLAGETANSNYVIGSNALLSNGKRLDWSNVANPAILQNRHKLVEFIQAFCIGRQSQELPSCNLALATNCNFRYPNINSAEDHHLVAELLMLYPEQGTILAEPLYAIYTIHGRDTQHNQSNNDWHKQRQRLAHMVECWQMVLESGVELLGAGLEGVVWREGTQVHKRFYPWAMTRQHVEQLLALLNFNSPHFPRVSWYCNDGIWHCCSTYEHRMPLERSTDKTSVLKFLRHLYKNKIAPLNIKRNNLMLSQTGDLMLIDIGKDIEELTVSRFLDISARMYSIGILGWSDEEVCRRKSTERQEDALKTIPGFEAFYRDLIMSLHPDLEAASAFHAIAVRTEDTSLLIKACAQDAEILESQVQHIVSQLSYPQSFSRVQLLLDTYAGPFLRQYAKSDLPGLIKIANKLQKDGWIDEILYAPDNHQSIAETYLSWFGHSETVQSHTSSNAPLFSQIWAFDQSPTRYLLQCDCDVLVGRKDISHDYLSEMKLALKATDVLSVGFNIPKAKDGFREYTARSGDYSPEVRMGLLDLYKIREQLPLANPLQQGRFNLTWHRALQRHQQLNGLRSLRGGDSRSFYIHPLNQDKVGQPLAKIRDLIAQGFYPEQQAEEFDLIPGPHWNYPKRSESIIFLLKGSQTAPKLMQRCIDSLCQQLDQGFGIILIDDNSNPEQARHLPHWLSHLRTRTTLIRRPVHVGRGVNFTEAIQHICVHPDSLIVILDQDDALLGNNVVTLLREELAQGADLIQMPMFRPDKPLKQYHPNYHRPRSNGGGEVWSHLRSFKKSLFDRIPRNYLYRGEEFIIPSDYSTMLAMVELAQKPVFIEQCYGYFHQRLPYSQRTKQKQHQMLKHIMSLPPLKRPSISADTKPVVLE